MNNNQNQTPAPANTAAPQGAPPPLSQDLASLANILTQIQYDLFDISIQLAQPADPDKPADFRVDDRAVTWITDLISKISKQLPQHQDPILPVGSQLACEFYAAKSMAQRTLTEITIFYSQHENAAPDNYKQITQYLQTLINLMFVIFRWSNLIGGEKEWFWKTKSQMNAENKQAQQAKAAAGQTGQPMQGQAPVQTANPNLGAPVSTNNPPLPSK